MKSESRDNGIQFIGRIEGGREGGREAGLNCPYQILKWNRIETDSACIIGNYKRTDKIHRLVDPWRLGAVSSYKVTHGFIRGVFPTPCSFLSGSWARNPWLILSQLIAALMSCRASPMESAVHCRWTMIRRCHLILARIRIPNTPNFAQFPSSFHDNNDLITPTTKIDDEEEWPWSS